jgi:hypothetical protein
LVPHRNSRLDALVCRWQVWDSAGALRVLLARWLVEGLSSTCWKFYELYEKFWEIYGLTIWSILPVLSSTGYIFTWVLGWNLWLLKVGGRGVMHSWSNDEANGIA